MWMVRAGSSSRFANKFIELEVIAIGWDELKMDISQYSKKQILDEVKKCWPNYKEGSANSAATQLFKFAHILKVGDEVVTYDSATRKYYIGRITGEHTFHSHESDGFSHQRNVTWNSKAVFRDVLTNKTKNTLGSTLTIFKLPDSAVKDLHAALNNNISEKPQIVIDDFEEESSEQNAEQMQAKAVELIKDKLVQLSWDQMQEMVAGLLRAMGYKTRISPSGADRGKDIVASPDGLGFEQPRIVVEVKHRSGCIGSQEIRSFLGGRHKDDKGLYVSTGGFTKDALYEAERAPIPLTLININDLVELLLMNYDGMDIHSQTLLPLSKVLWPSEPLKS